MLKMRAETAVGRDCGPVVAQHARLRLAEIHHRLYSKHHAFAQPGPVTAVSEVRNLRLFVQPRPYPVSHELPNHAKPGSLDVFLHCRSHITDRVADSRLLNAAVQRFFRHRQQFA